MMHNQTKPCHPTASPAEHSESPGGLSAALAGDRVFPAAVAKHGLMHLRKHIFVALLIALFGLAALILAGPKRAAPVALSVVSIVEGEATKCVTVECLRLEAAARFAETHQLHIRVGGKWQPPLTLPQFADGNLLARTNRQRLVFDLPLATEACRLSLSYRVGASPYCQAYGFLSRHGFSQKHPAIAKGILRHVPKQPRLRYCECEVELPAGQSEGSGGSPPALAAGRAFSATDASPTQAVVNRTASR
jgi:hypothetical protein